MNKKIFFALILYAALNAAENNYVPSCLPLSGCQDLAWLQNGTLLINACTEHPDNPGKLTRNIFSIDTQNQYKQKTLYIFDNGDQKACYITPNQDKTIALIALPGTSYIYHDGNITVKEELKTERRPIILAANQIIYINNNSLFVYDGINIKPHIQLNTAIKKMGSDTDPVHRFSNQIAKNPSTEEYLLSSSIDIFSWNTSSNELKLIDLPNLAITPISMSISPYDMQYHSNGTHVALTYDFAYNCWILNLLTKKLLLLQKNAKNKDMEELEKCRIAYESNKSDENGSKLIDASWKAAYAIDSKAFHPTLAVIATLNKNKALVKYWNINTGEKITKQVLPFKSNYKPHTCLPRLLAFSPDGKQIACGLDQGLAILNVPEQEIREKIDEKL